MYAAVVWSVKPENLSHDLPPAFFPWKSTQQQSFLYTCVCRARKLRLEEISRMRWKLDKTKFCENDFDEPLQVCAQSFIFLSGHNVLCAHCMLLEHTELWKVTMLARLQLDQQFISFWVTQWETSIFPAGHKTSVAFVFPIHGLTSVPESEWAMTLYLSYTKFKGHLLCFSQLKVSRPRPIFRQIHKTNDTRPWINRDGRGWGSADWGERVWGWVGKNWGKKQWEITKGNKQRDAVWDWQKKIQVNWDGTKTDVWFRRNGIWWHVGVESGQILSSGYWRWIESCTGNSGSRGDTLTPARIFCWVVSFCWPWWLPTSQRHTDCTYLSCSGIWWPFSALPTLYRSWSLSRSGTRCASTEPCCSGISCPKKSACGNWIFARKFVQSGRCNPFGLLQQQRWPCRRWSGSGTYRSVGIGLWLGSCKAFRWESFPGQFAHPSLPRRCAVEWQQPY